MLKTRIILIIIAIGFVWLLFLLPKVVVENDNQLSDQSPLPDNQSHGEIPQTILESIKKIRSEFSPGLSNQKNAIFADSLRNLYAQAGKFDSSAWYAEQAATFFNTKESFLNAGNSYYEAYTFAMTPDKQEQLAEKAREYLGRVLEEEPKNLEVKSKIAMTHLSKDPMQGISMLREIIEEDPDNVSALFNMGMLSIQSGQYDRAINWLEKLTAVDSTHVQGQLLLGVAYMNSNMKEKARQQFEKVKQLDKDPAIQATADSYLKDLK